VCAARRPNRDDEHLMSEHGDILEDVQRVIAELEAHPDPAVRTAISTLLQGIDAVHRSALTHLVGAIHAMAGEAFLNRLTADPAIRLLLMSYDLIAVDRRLHAEESLDSVRGHLHDHGIDVELTEVVGGAVYVKLHGLERSNIAVEAVRHDLEEALRAGLIGFQELVIGARATTQNSPLLQVGGLRRPQQPVYRRLCAAAAVPSGTMQAIDVDGRAILLANVDGEFVAVSNQCGESPLPLQFSTLQGAELRCSWHGCRYDLRSGRRLDGPEHLTVLSVAVENGEVRLATGTEPVAQG
jgi:nitrite reductase/ring-hydroxylating ferredoxin subunit